jgi:hypothetical protein
MADPIVFDCGGSTRIKQILRIGGGAGDMPGLLNVQDLSAVLGIPGATGSQHTINPAAPFANITIMFQDAAGTPFIIPVALPNNTILIESNAGQKVKGDFGRGGASLTITLFSTQTDPVVATKLNNTDNNKQRRRRYIVENAGPIKRITLDANVVYDSTNAEGPPPAPPIAPGAVGPAGAGAPVVGLPLYVSVVIR